MQQKNRRLQWVFSVTVLLCVGGFAGYLWSTPSPSPALSDTQRAVKVGVVQLSQGAHAPQARVFGRVVVPTPVTLRVKVSGTVESVLVSSADTVKLGQVLFRLDTTDLSRRLEQAKADKKAFEVRLKSEIRNNRLNIERRKKREKQFSSRLQSIQTNIASENQMYASIQDQRLTQIALLESLEKDLVAQTTLKKKGVLSERAWAQVERSVLSQRARIKDLDAQLKQHRYQISRMEQGIVDARLELDTALLELDTLIDTHGNRVQELQVQMKKVEIGIDMLQDDMKEAEYISPVAGKVDHVSVVKGADVSPGEMAVRVLPLDQYQIRVQLSDMLLQAIQAPFAEGRRIAAKIIAPDSLMETATNGLEKVLPSVSSGVRQGVVYFKATKLLHVYDLQPVTLELTLPKQEKVYPIPTTALYPGSKVFVLDEDAEDARLRAVKVEEVGYDWSNGTPRLLVRALESLDQRKIIAHYVPVAVEGLRVVYDRTKDNR